MRVLSGLASCLLLSWVLAADTATAQPLTLEEGLESLEDATDIVTAEPDRPGAEALAFNAKLLNELLLRAHEQTMREEKFAAAAGITGGAILVGLGTWRLVEDPPFNSYSRGLGIMFMTLGMADLTTGIFAATRIPHERRRIERWRKARSDGITPLELAHFEGELQSASETREGERLLVRWNGLTHAIAGVIVLAFTPIPDTSSRSERVSGYVIGGVFLATGLGAFAASFRGTPSEKAWTEYNQRKVSAPEHEFSWRLAPSFSRRGVGLSFGATF